MARHDVEGTPCLVCFFHKFSQVLNSQHLFNTKRSSCNVALSVPVLCCEYGIVRELQNKLQFYDEKMNIRHQLLIALCFLQLGPAFPSSSSSIIIGLFLGFFLGVA